MKNAIVILCSIVSSVLCLASCSSEDEIVKANQIIDLDTFRIRMEDNPGKLLADVEGVISAGKILLNMDRFDVLDGLVATFTFKGSRMLSNGITQISGETANNFSQPMTFTIQGEDGKKKEYTVVINLSTDEAMTRFTFQKKYNSDLMEDEECIIDGQNIHTFLSLANPVLIPTFETTALCVKVNGVKQESGMSEQDFSQPIIYELYMRNGETVQYTVKPDPMPSKVPMIYITTEDASITEIPSKEYYLNATIQIDGMGVYGDYIGTTEIKGRGNSTWGLPKKPYRLKLTEKASLCGFAKAKNYVLLANYLDPTLMLNAVTFKAARLLELPFTNHTVPVDVTLNGIYKGSYMLTEQVEVKANRVDLDEDNCILWELDTNFDEDLRFRSDYFELPVMVKDPDLSAEQFEYWKKDFNSFLGKFAEEPLKGNSYVDLIDIESVAKYILIYNLTHNMEINHPKSVYLHKEGNGKYVMGPVWDFDYEGTSRHFGNYNRSLWNERMTNGAGCHFFQRFLKDERVAELYKSIWTDFRNNKLPALLHYIEKYSKVLAPSASRNSEIWSKTKDFNKQVENLKLWLQKRAAYLDEEIQ